MCNFYQNSLSAIFILLIISKVEASSNSPAPFDPAADAKTIVDSKLDPKVIASILPYRTQDECIAINKAIGPLDGGTLLSDFNHIPLENSKPYDDLLFALVNDSLTIFSKYLGHYLHIRDETYIIMIYIQINERVKFKQTYDSQHDRCFDDARRAQRHPFANALRVWALQDRADEDDELVGPINVGQWLDNERPKWDKGTRDLLEKILMKHTIDYARIAIAGYQQYLATCPNLINDIKSNIKNTDLVDLYTSLVQYIENDNNYLATKLHDHCDDHDGFTMWIIVLSTRRTPDAMKALDKAFQNANNSTTLKDFVLKCPSQDPVLLNMLAALADPSYKPNEKPAPAPPNPPQG